MSVCYSEYRPIDRLSPFIEAYWLGNFNMDGEEDFSRLVIPNGCIELVVHLSDLHCSLYNPGSGWHVSPEFTLLGLYTKPYEVRFRHQVRAFGVRFYPDGLRQLFKVPPATFLSTYGDSGEILGSPFRQFCLGLRESDHISERVKLADAFFTRQLVSNYHPGDYTHRAMDRIRKSAGTTRYQLLTGQVPVGDRHLQRQFKNQYGISIRDYMRLSRLNAIQQYMRGGYNSLTDLSYEFAFADQSHFIREFKNYTGSSPRVFLKNRDRFIANPGRSAENVLH